MAGDTLKCLANAVISEMDESVLAPLSDREKTIVYWAIRYATDRIKPKLEIDTKAEG